MSINAASGQSAPPSQPTNPAPPEKGQEQRPDAAGHLGDDDDDDDEWDKRIKRTGCFDENERLLVCHADTGDWRKCAKEMMAFKKCMLDQGRFHDT